MTDGKMYVLMYAVGFFAMRLSLILLDLVVGGIFT